MKEDTSNEPAPTPALLSERCALSREVRPGLFAVCQCEPLPDQPFVDVDLAHGALRHHAPVAIRIALAARDGPPSDQVLECQRSFLTATPRDTGSIFARLAAFGCIDAEQPNALAMDFNGVAIDH